MATSTVFHIPSLFSLFGIAFKTVAEIFYALIKGAIEHPVILWTILALIALGIFKKWLNRL